MLKEHKERLINITKAVVVDGIDNDACIPTDDCDLSRLGSQDERDGVMALAKLHNISHIPSYYFLSFGHPEYANDFYVSLSHTTQQIEAANELSRELSREQIPHMLLKGSVIRRIYPEEWMRNGCDVDVLVKDEDLNRAGEALEHLGYTKGGRITHHVLYTRDSIEIELHFLLIEDFLNAKASRVLDGVWDVAQKSTSDESSYLYELPDEYAYYYYLAHMVRHFNRGGCGVRSVLDIWILNNRCSFDRKKREELLTRGGLSLFEKNILALADKWFSDGDGEGLELLEQWLISGGAYGESNRVESVMKSRQGNVFKYLLYVMFPPYIKMCHTYPVLKKHKLLLPLFYILRYFHLFYLLGIKRIFKRFYDMFKKDRSKKNIQKMLRQLGIMDLS